MAVVFVRVFILYAAILIVLRIMGKRQVSALKPHELVTIILIADVAAIPMATVGTPLLHGLIGVFALLTAQFTMSYVSFKSRHIRAFITGRPTIVIENGRIVEDAMEELRYNINDLLEQCRVLGHPNIHDIEFAVLETSGDLSVITKSQKRPVTPEDLDIETEYEGLPMPIIIDGNVDFQNLQRLQLDLTWLIDQLKAHGVSEIGHVLLATLDTNGRFFCQPKNLVAGGTP